MYIYLYIYTPFFDLQAPSHAQKFLLALSSIPACGLSKFRALSTFIWVFIVFVSLDVYLCIYIYIHYMHPKHLLYSMCFFLLGCFGLFIGSTFKSWDCQDSLTDLQGWPVRLYCTAGNREDIYISEILIIDYSRLNLLQMKYYLHAHRI